MKDIDAILTDEPVNEPAVAETPSEPEQPRDEHGRFAPKGVEQEEAPPASEPSQLPQEVYAPLKAVRDENKELKARLAELEAKANPPEPPKPIPSVFEDEQGFQDEFGNRVAAHAVSQATLNARLDMSEMLVRQANSDFEDVKAEFLKLAEANPTLREQALNDPHPWNKAYQIAKNHKAMQELGAVDVNDLREKLKAEILAEMGSRPPSLPPTLSNERNVGQRTGPAWSGPRPLSELLG